MNATKTKNLKNEFIESLRQKGFSVLSHTKGISFTCKNSGGMGKVTNGMVDIRHTSFKNDTCCLLSFPVSSRDLNRLINFLDYLGTYKGKEWVNDRGVLISWSDVDQLS